MKWQILSLNTDQVCHFTEITCTYLRVLEFHLLMKISKLFKLSKHPPTFFAFYGNLKQDIHNIKWSDIVPVHQSSSHADAHMYFIDMVGAPSLASQIISWYFNFDYRRAMAMILRFVSCERWIVSVFTNNCIWSSSKYFFFFTTLHIWEQQRNWKIPYVDQVWMQWIIHCIIRLDLYVVEVRFYQL